MGHRHAQVIERRRMEDDLRRGLVWEMPPSPQVLTDRSRWRPRQPKSRQLRVGAVTLRGNPGKLPRRAATQTPLYTVVDGDGAHLFGNPLSAPMPLVPQKKHDAGRGHYHGSAKERRARRQPSECTNAMAWPEKKPRPLKFKREGRGRHSPARVRLLGLAFAGGPWRPLQHYTPAN